MMDTAMTRTELRDIHYRALADFRYQIRRFLSFSERAARAAGLEPRQHQALLALKGLPEDKKGTVGVLAERLQIEHHTAVELADRLVAKGLIIRSKSQADRREVLLQLTRRGEKVLQELSRLHRAELSSAGPKLLRALETAVRLARKSKRARSSSPTKRSGGKNKPKRR
jgi:DNA-binding MarR family transcriptional regulator